MIIKHKYIKLNNILNNNTKKSEKYILALGKRNAIKYFHYM